MIENTQVSKQEGYRYQGGQLSIIKVDFEMCWSSEEPSLIINEWTSRKTRVYGINIACE